MNIAAGDLLLCQGGWQGKGWRLEMHAQRLANIACLLEQGWCGWAHLSLHMADSGVNGFATHQLNSQPHCVCWLLIIPFHTWKPDFQGARRQMPSADSRMALITLACRLLAPAFLDPPGPSIRESQLLSRAKPQPSHQGEQTFWAPPSITQTPMSDLMPAAGTQNAAV